MYSIIFVAILYTVEDRFHDQNINEEPGALERGAVLLVHVAEELREQAVTAHGVADTGLAVQL